MTKKNYPLRDVDGVPIGSTVDAETARLLTEATIAEGEVVLVAASDGLLLNDAVCLLQQILDEQRKITRQFEVWTGNTFETGD